MMLKLMQVVAIASLCTASMQAFAQPVVTDSRIKTLVYNANDVYRIVTHHGYQSHIEFGEKEFVQTISIGDKISWQIIPDGRRLFIRSLIGGAHTNLTVVTNLRTYQFDIESTEGGKVPAREDLVYVVRFYYPDEFLPKSAAYTLPPVYADEMIDSLPPQANEVAAQPVGLPALNFDYTFTGDQALAPSRVFDDGKATYFKLNSDAVIYVTGADGREMPVSTTPTSDGFQKAPFIRDKFIVRYPQGAICVYNEKINGGAV